MNEEEEEILDRDKRIRRPPNYLKDYVLLPYPEALNDFIEWKDHRKNYVSKILPARHVKDALK